MARRKSLYSVINQSVPPIPAQSALFVVAIPLIPYLIGKLEVMRRTTVWNEGEDTQIGDNLLGEQIMALIQPVMSTDNLYRLLDTALNGTVYGYTVDEGVYTYTPPIPVVPPPTDAAILPTLAKLRETSTFFVTGSEEYTTPLTTDMTLQSRLQAVIDAINAGGTDNTAILAELANILLALA